jgi:hypothetical protein
MVILAALLLKGKTPAPYAPMLIIKKRLSPGKLIAHLCYRQK